MCWINPPGFRKHSIRGARWTCAFCCSFFSPALFSFPSSFQRSLWSCVSAHGHVPTCLWASACPWTPACALGCSWGRPLLPSLISTFTVPVCWQRAMCARTHTHTRFPIIYTQIMADNRVLKLQKTTTDADVDNDCAAGGALPSCTTGTLRGTCAQWLTFTLAGRRAQVRQLLPLKATDSAVGHQSKSSFSSPPMIQGCRETPCLNWYLCAAAFFSALSWLEFHNAVWKTAKKEKSNGGQKHKSYCSLCCVDRLFLLCSPKAEVSAHCYANEGLQMDRMTSFSNCPYGIWYSKCRAVEFLLKVANVTLLFNSENIFLLNHLLSIAAIESNWNTESFASHQLAPTVWSVHRRLTRSPTVVKWNGDFSREEPRLQSGLTTWIDSITPSKMW